MVYCLLRNNGADDLTYVQVKDGDEVVAEKLYTVCGGSWRVVEIPVTIATPGAHTITVGTQSGTITIAEKSILIPPLGAGFGSPPLFRSVK